VIKRVEPTPEPAAVRARLNLRWWKELIYIAGFYLIYSWVRNQFGSDRVGPSQALDHALDVISLEKRLGLFVEGTVQSWFVRPAADGIDYMFSGAQQFLYGWNLFYGTFHFVVTAGVLLWLYRRFPTDYPRWRDALAFGTGLALIGFALYPLMPPRLLPDCGIYGACLDQFQLVDTLSEVGSLWSFDSGAMQKVSNQYAAMPSLHFGWALWCFAALYPRLQHRWSRLLIGIYPWLTLWAIVVTANHYWIDALGGAVTIGVGYLAGRALATRMVSRRERHLAARDVTTTGDEFPPVDPESAAAGSRSNAGPDD
jgi:hypothetical protein